MDIKLPIYADNKRTGNIAADILKSVLQKFAIVNTHDESIDLGIDMRAQIIEKRNPTQYFFNIQSKGTDELDTKEDEQFFSIQIKITTINYWNQQNDTTFLFLVDNATGNCYWCNPLIVLEDRMEQIQSQDSVILKIPKKNCINRHSKALPKEFMQNITIYIANQLNKGNILLEQLNKSLQSNTALDLNFSIDLLKVFLEESDRMKNNTNKIIQNLIRNIKENLKKSNKYFDQLFYSHSAKSYVQDFYSDKGFMANKKSYNDLNKEFDDIIDQLESGAEEIKYKVLDSLKENYFETLDFQVNVLGFLIEMNKDDDPWGDHSKISAEFDKIWEKKMSFKKNL